jgi:toxin ParE1/3/4
VLVEFRAEARAEIDDAFAWYERQSPGLGSDFLRAVEACAESISRRPDTWPLIYKNLRRRLLRRFPYSLIYRVDPDRVVVVACFHARRDPQRWRSR